MKRRGWVFVALGLAVLSGAAWFVLRQRTKLPDNLVSVVPADAYGVVRIRVDRVLGSEAWKRLVVERGQARGMERVTKTCGFNPLARMKELVVFARPSADGGLPRVAFVARGDLAHGELATCVRKVTAVDADKLRVEELDGIPTVASTKGNSRAAFFGGDGLVAGDTESVRDVIKVLRGKARGALGDSLTRGLFEEVERGQDVAFVARIPETLRPKLRQLAASRAGANLGPLAEVRALAGNLNVGQAKLAGGTILLMPDAGRATAVVGLARGGVDHLLRMPGLGLTPAGAVLRGIQTEARGDRATFAASIKVSTAEALLELLPGLE